jgi:hypothetical protein
MAIPDQRGKRNSSQYLSESPARQDVSNLDDRERLRDQLWQSLAEAISELKSKTQNKEHRLDASEPGPNGDSSYMKRLLDAPLFAHKLPPKDDAQIPWRAVVSLIEFSGTSLDKVLLTESERQLDDSEQHARLSRRLKIVNLLCKANGHKASGI